MKRPANRGDDCRGTRTFKLLLLCRILEESSQRLRKRLYSLESSDYSDLERRRAGETHSFQKSRNESSKLDTSRISNRSLQVLGAARVWLCTDVETSAIALVNRSVQVVPERRRRGMGVGWEERVYLKCRRTNPPGRYRLCCARRSVWRAHGPLRIGNTRRQDLREEQSKDT